MQLPSGLYNQYTEVLNTTPLMQMNLQRKQQLEAKKAAKEEALNQYFHDLPSTLNTAGVRDVDIEPISQDVNSLRSEFIKNKSEILKGGVAQQQYLSKFEKVSRMAAKSKERAKFLLELGKKRYEEGGDVDDNDIALLEKIGKSVYDPTSYKEDGVSEFGWNDLSQAIPEFNADKQNKFWGNIGKGVSAGEQFDFTKSTKDKETNSVLVPYQKTFTPQQIDVFARQAHDAASTDKSVKRHYEKIANDHTSDKWLELNKAYQSFYGQDKIANTPEELAAADAIIRFSTPQEQGMKRFNDKEADRRQQIVIKNMSGGGKGSGGSESKIKGNVLDGMQDGNWGNFETSGGLFYKKDGSEYNGTVFIAGKHLPTNIKSVLKAGGIDPLLLTNGVDAEIKDGRIISISNKAIGSVSREDMEGIYQPKFDTERKGESLVFPNSKEKQTKKPSESKGDWKSRAIKVN